MRNKKGRFSRILRIDQTLNLYSSIENYTSY